VTGLNLHAILIAAVADAEGRLHYELKSTVKYDGPPVGQMSRDIAQFHAHDVERIKREDCEYLEREGRG
jgi:hypothetical protein